MQEQQSTEHETWRFLDDGNFSMTEHSILFAAPDSDPVIEQVWYIKG